MCLKRVSARISSIT